ncbi:hypothetical protein C6P45_004173 [Maudiozyma exigua]|uniref:Uncharacterized protein n=1 Tax=Maudiozyma exigua TaxID=34358 RepID=A0A9P6WC83_MAUEX|nr:hypothetical protein C6P45_004173 [Kazachstania exigua]
MTYTTMSEIISSVLSLIVSVILPLHVTLETVYLSKDSNAMSSFVKSSSMLQPQTEQNELTTLLLKYWALHGVMYLLIPHTPLKTIIDIIPLSGFILFVYNCLATIELLGKFTKFIIEQQQFLTNFLKFIESFKDPKKSKLEQFTKLYQSSFTNYYNQKYHTDIRDQNLVDSFLFGNYTDSVIALCKRYGNLVPMTNIIPTCFDFIVMNIINLKNSIQSYYNFADEHTPLNPESSEKTKKENHSAGSGTSTGSAFHPGSFDATNRSRTGTPYEEYNIINDLLEQAKNLFNPPNTTPQETEEQPNMPDLD